VQLSVNDCFGKTAKTILLDNLQMETARLYQDAGVNPLAGCLPTLATLPVRRCSQLILAYSLHLPLSDVDRSLSCALAPSFLGLSPFFLRLFHITCMSFILLV
jgi:membrane protein insertase Oxa1/YidC/SpoIIIJ